MNNMRALTFAAIAGAAVIGEAIQYGTHVDPALAPAMVARNDCPALPALCTGPAMISGMDMTLTYICPQTSTKEAATTVHVTVTATTTVTEFPGSSAPASVPDLAPAPASSTNTPHGPDEPASMSAEATTTTTIHSTTKVTKTLTLTHKTDSDVAPSAPVATSSSNIIGSDLSSTQHSTGSWGWSGSVPTHWFPPTTSDAVPTIIPSQLIPPISHVMSDDTSSIASSVPVSSPMGTAPITSILSVTAVANSQPAIIVNSTSTRGYQFPPLQVREDASVVTPKKGGVGQTGVSIAALALGMGVVAYFW